jgi:hypothetical protein
MPVLSHPRGSAASSAHSTPRPFFGPTFVHQLVGIAQADTSANMLQPCLWQGEFPCKKRHYALDFQPVKANIVTARPGSVWVTQKARNLAIEDRLGRTQFLIRERDAKYSGPFDEVFRCEGVRIIRTPIRSPKANAFAERFVKNVRRECLDHILVLGEHHPERILKEYVSHYNRERPHRGLSLETPEPKLTSNRADAEIVLVDRLGGLTDEYHRIAA